MARPKIFRSGQYVCKGAGQVYGCYWHGCKSCYHTSADTTRNAVNGKTMSELHAETVRNIGYLHSQKYKLQCIWECKLNKQRKKDEDLDSFFKQHIHHLKEK